MTIDGVLIENEEKLEEIIVFLSPEAQVAMRILFHEIYGQL